MSLFDRLQKRLDEEDKRERFLLRPFHSSSYHRHFEGYTEYRRTDASGKKRITCVYTGEYYQQDTEKTARIAYRVIYLVLYVTALLGLLTGTTADTEANCNLAVNISTALCVPVFFWIALSLVNYLIAPQRMKIGEYKAGPLRLKKSALVCSILCGVHLISLVAFGVLTGSGFSKLDLKVAGYALLCTACMLLIYRIEQSVGYSIIQNPIQPERDGVEIH